MAVVNNSISTLVEQVQNIRNDPPLGYFCGPPTKFDGETLKIGLRGTWGTIYEGGCYLLEVKFAKNPLAEPPTLKFITPIYHLNVNVQGYVRMKQLSQEWRPSFTLRYILECLRLLLSFPQLECPAVMPLALQFLHDPTKFVQNGKHWTRVFAFAFDSFETYRSLDEVEEVTKSLDDIEARARFYGSVLNNFGFCSVRGYPHERNCANCDAWREKNKIMRPQLISPDDEDLDRPLYSCSINFAQKSFLLFKIMFILFSIWVYVVLHYEKLF